MAENWEKCQFPFQKLAVKASKDSSEHLCLQLLQQEITQKVHKGGYWSMQALELTEENVPTFKNNKWDVFKLWNSQSWFEMLTHSF